MPRLNKPIAVIGAGVAGVTTAYKLAKAGYEVCLFEKHNYPAMETSYANGGQLSASNAEVWNSWTTVLKGMKWMLTPSAPLLLNPKPSWHKLSWLAEFLGGIGKYEASTETTARMAISARAHLKAMAEEEGISFDCEMRGILHFYRSREAFESATRVTEVLGRAGLHRRAVTPREIESIEPALKGRLYGGYYTESDFTGDIHKFTVGLAEACRRLGVVQKFGCEIIGVSSGADGIRIRCTSPHSFDEAITANHDLQFSKVVICAGVHSRKFAAQLGDRVNVYPVKGYSITVCLNEPVDREAAPWVSLLDDDAKVVTSRLGKDRFRVAGTAEFNGFNLDIRNDRIAPLIAWCQKHFPGMSTRQCIPWAGLRPMMPDMMPRVFSGRKPGVHGHLGWTLSAATAEIITLRILEADRAGSDTGNGD